MAASAFKLGEWTVEPDLNLLVSPSGEEVRLEPKLMDVLAYLCERHGEVVSSDEIVDALWHDYPVSDNPVYNAIGRLRQVLGDDPKHPKYIQTIASRGYRIIAEVTGTARINGQGGDRERKTNRWVPVAVIIVAAIGAGMYFATTTRQVPTEAPTHSLVSAFPGSHESPSFSPDGSRIAFVSDESGTPQIWTFEFETSKRQQITDHASPSDRPRWSPTDDRILYHREGSLWSITSAGADERRLITNGYNPDWAPDGRRIVFERRGEIWVADANGSNQYRLDGLPTQDMAIMPRRPIFSPDGKTIAYFHAPTSPLGDWWLVPSDGGSTWQLTFDEARNGWATWSTDGKHLIASSQRAGSRTLWSIPVAGGEPKPVLFGAGDDDTPAVWKDKLIYSTRQDRFTLCVTDFATGETEELFSSSNDVVMPRFSPDETEIAFFAMLETGDTQVLAVPRHGGQERSVTADIGARNQIQEWSADGNAMYFYRTKPTPAFMKNDARGGPSEIVADGWSWIKENSARVHPSKPKIIYSRLDRGVATETMIHDLTDGSDAVFPIVLDSATWSRAGDRVAGNRSDQQLVVCDEFGTKCEQLGQWGLGPIWSSDDQTLFFERFSELGLEIFSIELSDKSTTLIGEVGPILPAGLFYDVSRNLEVAWVRWERGTGVLWLTSFSE